MNYNDYEMDVAFRERELQASAALPALMRKVYVWMTLALAITGFTAYAVAATPNLQQIVLMNSWVMWGLIIAEFALVMGISWGINKLSLTTATLLFVLYSVINGATLSVIFVAYSIGTISKVFFITAGTFAVMAFIVILLAKGARERVRMILMSIFMLAGYILYAAALLYMYIHLFTEYEGENLASFERYMFTFIMGAAIFFLYMIIEKIFARFGGFGNILILVPIAVVLIFTPWSRVTSDMFNCSETVEKTISRRADFYRFEEIAKEWDYEKDRVYFIAQDSNGFEYQQAYYLATPVSLSYDFPMGWSLGFPYSDKDVWTIEMSQTDWEKTLIDGGYTYVYLYNVDKQFRTRYGQMFEYETAISNNSAFKVEVNGGHVILKRAF